MTATTYARYEVLRTFRNRWFPLFSLAFPLLLFFLVAGPNRDATLDDIPFPLYYMAGMAAWGSMAAVVGSGARIAAERQVGWHRQLRITPLRSSAYLATKVLTGYLMAGVTILALYVAGTILGVRVPAGDWLAMTGLVLVGLVPFAALGIFLGHRLSADAMGPALGGVVTLFALLGGAWGPFATDGWMRRSTELLPSYWLVQAGHVATGAGAWPLQGWLVVAAWSAAFGALAVHAFRGDTERA
jgi:ABC-2 type transport system permease protein